MWEAQQRNQVCLPLAHAQRAPPGTLVVKNQPANAGHVRHVSPVPGWGRSHARGQEGMAAHSSILAWRIPWTEEPGGLQSIGALRVGCNWGDLALMHAQRNTMEREFFRNNCFQWLQSPVSPLCYSWELCVNHFLVCETISFSWDGACSS